LSTNRKFLRDRLQRAINHLEEANRFLGEAYGVFSKYGDHYGKYKEYLIAVGQTIEFAKENIERLLEHI
jgi:uncharacterized protein (DUF488 family)